MLLYDMGDPIHAVEILGPDIRSVHVKDANRPTIPGHWGEEVPLGQGEVDIPRFIQTLKAVGYAGPLVVEREVGDQAGRIRDVKHGLDLLRDCLAEPAGPAIAASGVRNSECARGVRSSTAGVRPEPGVGGDDRRPIQGVDHDPDHGRVARPGRCSPRSAC